MAERIVADLRGLHPVHGSDGFTAPGVFDVSGSVGVTELDPVASTPRPSARPTSRCARPRRRARAASGRRVMPWTARRPADQAAVTCMAALEQEQFRVMYQPVVGLAERRILSGWRCSCAGTTRCSVPPDEFISLAEMTGLIVTLQRWVLQRATTDAAALLAAGWDVQMGINVSVRRPAGQAAGLQVADRDVDPHLHVPAGGQQRGSVGRGALEHPALQGHDQPVVLREGDELVGRDGAEHRVVPAHERLQPEDAPFGQADDGLVHHAELLLLERGHQVAGQPGPPAGRRCRWHDPPSGRSSCPPPWPRAARGRPGGWSWTRPPPGRAR